MPLNKTAKLTRLIALLFAVTLLVPFAKTALVLQSFTCNDNLPNVQVGVPFTCIAVVLNDDVNADASLNSVALSALNGWTDSVSYTGSYSGSTVTRGGSVTVTFSGLVPTSSGPAKTFSYVLINEVNSNPEVLANSPVNVVAIKTLNLNAPSNLTGSGSFELQASTAIGGRANLSLSITASGCLLASGEPSSVNLGSVEDSTQSITWNVNKGSTFCLITVSALAVANPVNAQKIALLSQGSSSSSSSSNTTSESGGGAGSSNTTNATKEQKAEVKKEKESKPIITSATSSSQRQKKPQEEEQGLKTKRKEASNDFVNLWTVIGAAVVITILLIYTGVIKIGGKPKYKKW